MKTLHDAHRRAHRLLVAGCLVGLAAGALAQSAAHPCGEIANSYGPFDYRTQRNMLGIVERVHFLPDVERFIRPTPMNFGDLDYTLRASPNHHRALISLARFGETKAPVLGNARSVDCYFDRAIRFAPDDAVVRMIYASLLVRTARGPEALKQIDFVAQSAKDNPFTHYNLGLLYLEMKQYGKALEHAHAAMQLGLPRSELRDALKKAGKWTDPQAAAPAGAASAASPAS